MTTYCVEHSGLLCFVLLEWTVEVELQRRRKSRGEQIVSSFSGTRISAQSWLKALLYPFLGSRVKSQLTGSLTNLPQVLKEESVKNVILYNCNRFFIFLVLCYACIIVYIVFPPSIFYQATYFPNPNYERMGTTAINCETFNVDYF